MRIAGELGLVLLVGSLALLPAGGGCGSRPNPAYRQPADGGTVPGLDGPVGDGPIVADGAVPGDTGPFPGQDRPIGPGRDGSPPPPPDAPDPPPPPPPGDGSTGDACQSDDDCDSSGQGNAVCVTELPGGYCTRACSPNQPDSCPEDAACVSAGEGAFVCARRCESDADCRAGYACSGVFLGQLAGAAVCAPGTSEPVAIGAPCSTGTDCQSDQFCLDRFTGGYCSAGCDPTNLDSCGPGAVCINTGDGGLCLATCAEAADCAALRGGNGKGYGCSRRVFGAPSPRPVCLPFNPQADIGDPCQGEGDCPLGGLCLVEQPDTPVFPGGYCSRLCLPNGRDNCAPGAICELVPGEEFGLCFASCQTSADCRQEEGYFCGEVTQNQPACFPP